MSDPEAVAWRIYARRQPVSDAARQYLLPAAEGIRIFQERIIPDLLTGPQPQEQPTICARPLKPPVPLVTLQSLARPPPRPRGRPPPGSQRRPRARWQPATRTHRAGRRGG